MFGLAVLTVSTSGYYGQRDDASGDRIKELLPPPDYELVRYEIVSDDKDMIAQRMAEWADAPDVNLIISTGGTGLGPRDVTPEACLSIIEREVPGLAETMRAPNPEIHPHGHAQPVGSRCAGSDPYPHPPWQPQRCRRNPGSGHARTAPRPGTVAPRVGAGAPGLGNITEETVLPAWLMIPIHSMQVNPGDT